MIQNIAAAFGREGEFCSELEDICASYQNGRYQPKDVETFVRDMCKQISNIYMPQQAQPIGCMRLVVLAYLILFSAFVYAVP